MFDNIKLFKRNPIVKDITAERMAAKEGALLLSTNIKNKTNETFECDYLYDYFCNTGITRENGVYKAPVITDKHRHYNAINEQVAGAIPTVGEDIIDYVTDVFNSPEIGICLRKCYTDWQEVSDTIALISSKLFKFPANLTMENGKHYITLSTDNKTTDMRSYLMLVCIDKRVPHLYLSLKVADHSFLLLDITTATLQRETAFDHRVIYRVMHYRLDDWNSSDSKTLMELEAITSKEFFFGDLAAAGGREVLGEYVTYLYNKIPVAYAATPGLIQ